MTHGIDGVRFTVMGLGVLGGGVGVARYLVSHGGIVTVTDMRPADQLQTSIDMLTGLPITYHLGGHDEADFRADHANVVVRNPGVRAWSPYLAIARESGVRIEMEMSLFFRACPAPILGVTGTKGKTSVSTLCGTILAAWQPETVLAGNMGVSALAQLDDITPDCPVVIELSSWQLEALNEHRLGCHVAVITNVSPDHLDAYDSYEHYVATKRTIAAHVPPGGWVIYNHDDPAVRPVEQLTAARLLPFGLDDPGRDGCWATETELLLRLDGTEQRILRPTQLQLQGENGLRNCLAAFAATWAYGAPLDAIRRGFAQFRGVPNRMEEVGETGGIRFINDTSATAPAAAVGGLRVLAEQAARVHVICGGSDKKVDLSPFADEVAALRPAVYLLDGTGTALLMPLLQERGVSWQGPFPSMASAFAAAVANAHPGDIVTLTPACASFGMFRNEFDRGDQFRAAAHEFITTQR